MKIAILSNGNANYSTRRLVEEAEKRGHDVKVIKYKNCYISIAQHDNQVFYKGKPLGKFDAVIPRISSSMTRYGTAIVRQLEMQGDGVPKTVVSRNTTDIDELLEQLEPPVIIKLASGTHGNGVVLAETKKAAKSVMQAFYLTDDSGTNVLLQEFIKESAGTDIRAFVVGSKVVASMQRKSLDDDFRSNLHKGGSGTIIKLTTEEEKIAVRAAKVMGLTIAGVDIMRSSRGPLVLEVNASPGFGIERVTGRNVAGKIIEYVEHNAKRTQRKDKVGA